MRKFPVWLFVIVMEVTAFSTNRAGATEALSRARFLADECKTDTNGCEEYLLGLLEGTLLTQNIEFGKFVVICPATRPQGSELRLAFEKWVRENPDKLDDLSRATAGSLALKHTYPCSSPTPSEHRE